MTVSNPDDEEREKAKFSLFDVIKIFHKKIKIDEWDSLPLMDHERIVSLLFIKELLSKMEDEKRNEFRKNKSYARLLFKRIDFIVASIVRSIRSNHSTRRPILVGNTIQISPILETTDSFWDDIEKEISNCIKIETLEPYAQINQFIDNLNIVCNEDKAPERYLALEYIYEPRDLETVITQNGSKIVPNTDKNYHKLKKLMDLFKKKHVSSSIEGINLFIYILRRYGFDSGKYNYLDRQRKFEKSLLKGIFNKNQHKEDNTIRHLKNIFKVSNLVSWYKPPSIDYFMVRIAFFAPHEFSGHTQEEKSKRIAMIHKYTKYMIANEILYSSEYSYAAKEEENYIKIMLRKLNLKSHYANIPIEDFLKENVKVINFNYDNTLLLIFHELLEKGLADDVIKNNFEYVYGQLTLKDQDSQPILVTQDNALWKAIFWSHENEKDSIDKILISKPFVKREMHSCPDLLEQCSDCIKWIGEDESEGEREKLQSWLKEASKIYFLGFGFDKNNLYRMGLIDENEKLSIEWEQDVDIFVAKGSPGIVAMLATLFDTKEVCQIENLFLLNKEKKDCKIRLHISSNSAPVALTHDFKQ